MTDTVWICEQWRAGKVYNKIMFNTREEAEMFAAQTRGVEPDLLCSIEAIRANQVWN